MKRKLLGLLIAVLLLTIIFSGCNETTTKNEIDRFVGTWSVQIPDDVNSTIDFFSNGTFFWNKIYYDLSGTFSIADEKITMNYMGDIGVLKYSFSDNDTKLVFSDPTTGTFGWFLTRK